MTLYLEIPPSLGLIMGSLTIFYSLSQLIEDARSRLSLVVPIRWLQTLFL